MPFRQRVYALASDYYELTGDDDPTLDEEGNPLEDPTVDKKLNARLRSASEEIESLTRLAVYATDDDGYPTDLDVADAFKRATCAVVQFWGITDDETGAEADSGAVSIGSVSLGTTSARTDTGNKVEKIIGSKAARILGNAGLLSAIVSHT